MSILVTGGAGYIGSHTTLELLKNGYHVVVVDNLSNSKEESLKRVQEIAGKKIKFYKIDILDKEEFEEVFKKERIDAVVHFAGFKAVGESVEKPLKYYHNNITGTLVLCELMQKYGVKDIVFSSSATVYGDPKEVPIKENAQLHATNPYGKTKLMIEKILHDLYKSDRKWNIAILRYFNPIGAHSSGKIGEDPRGIPNNLLPYVSQVAVGKLESVSVFGNDYDTPDGTGVRDYIHVVDLANGHIKALEKLNQKPGYVVYNLGTGNGYSVLDVINAFAKASGKEIPYKIVERRHGDIAQCYAEPGKARRELQWVARKKLDEMCMDSWRWQLNNPFGYETKNIYSREENEMNKLTLVIMAAGMGSRYGGLKQIDPVGPNGEMIIDYSIYDALKAGFGKIVFIIRRELEDSFREKIGRKIEQIVDVEYVYQDVNDIPEGFTVPKDRAKPWGTAHAILSCKKVVDSSFAVINADDYYGASSYKALSAFLNEPKDAIGMHQYCMVGYILEKTLTDYGRVARGVCKVDDGGNLIEITERTRIEKFGKLSKYLDDNEKWTIIPQNSIVSMNSWGFDTTIFDEIEDRFPKFMKDNKDSLFKAEFFLPEVVGALMKENKAKIKVLPSLERWYGITYKEDKATVKNAIQNLIDNEVYPDNLWDEYKRMSYCKMWIRILPFCACSNMLIAMALDTQMCLSPVSLKTNQ